VDGVARGVLLRFKLQQDAIARVSSRGISGFSRTAFSKAAAEMTENLPGICNPSPVLCGQARAMIS
jgi:hypothetical protein